MHKVSYTPNGIVLEGFGRLNNRRDYKGSRLDDTPVREVFSDPVAHYIASKVFVSHKKGRTPWCEGSCNVYFHVTKKDEPTPDFSTLMLVCEYYRFGQIEIEELDIAERSLLSQKEYNQAQYGRILLVDTADEVFFDTKYAERIASEQFGALDGDFIMYKMVFKFDRMYQPSERKTDPNV